MQNVKLKKSKIYGKELILDLYDCDPEMIRSKEKILEYLNKICHLIKVKKYGKAMIERFGKDTRWKEGYSFFQFIEESSISGHFLEKESIAFLNIFSCKFFDEKRVIDFTKKFFKSQKVKKKSLLR
jgi:S-adenosylmethionine/arginine decarboxylase-like enzyme